MIHAYELSYLEWTEAVLLQTPSAKFEHEDHHPMTYVTRISIKRKTKQPVKKHIPNVMYNHATGIGTVARPLFGRTTI